MKVHGQFHLGSGACQYLQLVNLLVMSTLLSDQRKKSSIIRPLSLYCLVDEVLQHGKIMPDEKKTNKKPDILFWFDFVLRHAQKTKDFFPQKLYKCCNGTKQFYFFWTWPYVLDSCIVDGSCWSKSSKARHQSNSWPIQLWSDTVRSIKHELRVYIPKGVFDN